jgi:hypothetical protein
MESKWKYLLESDSSFRGAEREYIKHLSDENTLRFAHEILKNPPTAGDTRFDRLLTEFVNAQATATANALVLDYKRITGPPDKEVSEHCNLKGKMGGVCHQANQAEITTRYFVFLVSYQTPVAYRSIATGNEFHTKTRHSITTNSHIRKWTSASSVPVTQEEIDELFQHFRGYRYPIQRVPSR